MIFKTDKHPANRSAGRIWAGLVAVATVALWVCSIPPFAFAEAAYIAFVPLLIWIYSRPSPRATLLVGLGVGWLSWLIILIWLRHVTWIGTVALSGVLALLFLAWLTGARWLLPRLVERAFPIRLIGFAGVAGAWVLIEWARSWLLWGFPWAPLALSQWERPVVLQLSAWTGAYGVSFLLLAFNLCVAHTLWRRLTARERKTWSGWFSPELYLALGGLAACVYLFFESLPARDSGRELFAAGVVQPYIPAELKWDEARELENFEILERQTWFVDTLEPDLLLWPEAATPWPVIGHPQTQERVEGLVDQLKTPILMGTIARLPEEGIWMNGAALVKPETGLDPQFYAKRELVPFGEYVPAPFHVIVDKFVPLEGSFHPGQGPELIELELRGQRHRIGPLVCYEDIFPALARESVRAGADLLFVTTNNAWYGEEGGGPQHAAHSVLRAVENRRPVIRVGNGGWSGWIDAYGTIRKVIVDENGSIYFRGGGTFTPVQYEPWFGRQSFYTRFGDWFVLLCAATVLGAGLVGKLKH